MRLRGKLVAAWALLLAGIWAGRGALGQSAADPIWWDTPSLGAAWEGPVVSIWESGPVGAGSEDHEAPVNVGQLKHVAHQARDYLDYVLRDVGGAGWELDSLVDSFGHPLSDPDEHFAPATVGQLKAVAEPYYERLRTVGYDVNGRLVEGGLDPMDLATWYPEGDLLPWDPTVTPGENLAPINVGQMKFVFSFDLGLGLPAVEITQPASGTTVDGGLLTGISVEAVPGPQGEIVEIELVAVNGEFATQNIAISGEAGLVSRSFDVSLPDRSDVLVYATSTDSFGVGVVSDPILISTGAASQPLPADDGETPAPGGDLTDHWTGFAAIPALPDVESIDGVTLTDKIGSASLLLDPWNLGTKVTAFEIKFPIVAGADTYGIFRKEGAGEQGLGGWDERYWGSGADLLDGSQHVYDENDIEIETHTTFRIVAFSGSIPIGAAEVSRTAEFRARIVNRTLEFGIDANNFELNGDLLEARIDDLDPPPAPPANHSVSAAAMRYVSPSMASYNLHPGRIVGGNSEYLNDYRDMLITRGAVGWVEYWDPPGGPLETFTVVDEGVGQLISIPSVVTFADLVEGYVEETIPLDPGDLAFFPTSPSPVFDIDGDDRFLSYPGQFAGYHRFNAGGGAYRVDGSFAVGSRYSPGQLNPDHPWGSGNANAVTGVRWKHWSDSTGVERVVSEEISLAPFGGFEAVSLGDWGDPNLITVLYPEVSSINDVNNAYLISDDVFVGNWASVHGQTPSLDYELYSYFVAPVDARVFNVDLNLAAGWTPSGSAYLDEQEESVGIEFVRLSEISAYVGAVAGGGEAPPSRTAPPAGASLSESNARADWGAGRMELVANQVSFYSKKLSGGRQQDFKNVADALGGVATEFRDLQNAIIGGNINITTVQNRLDYASEWLDQAAAYIDSGVDFFGGTELGRAEWESAALDAAALSDSLELMSLEGSFDHDQLSDVMVTVARGSESVSLASFVSQDGSPMPDAGGASGFAPFVVDLLPDWFGFSWSPELSIDVRVNFAAEGLRVIQRDKVSGSVYSELSSGTIVFDGSLDDWVNADSAGQGRPNLLVVPADDAAPGSYNLEVTVDVRGSSGDTIGSVGGDSIEFIVPSSNSAEDGAISYAVAAGKKYRKVSLAGLPLPDEKPQAESEEDEAPEETHVDAFDLRLAHDTSDIYVPVGASTELSLSVKRSFGGEVWERNFSGTPDERSDLAFGPGWSSNLQSFIEFSAEGVGAEAYTGNRMPPNLTASVVDESGAKQRFTELYTAYDLPANPYRQLEFAAALTDPSNQAGYFQRLEDLGEIDVGNGELRRQFRLVKKYGTTVLYELTDVQYATSRVAFDGSTFWGRAELELAEVQDELDSLFLSAAAAGEEVTSLEGAFKVNHFKYARAVEVTDRLGYKLRYVYEDGAGGLDSLIPVRIVAEKPILGANGETEHEEIPGMSIYIRQAGGRITEVIDPRGNSTTYAYEVLGAADRVSNTALDGFHVLRSASRGSGLPETTTVTYGYDAGNTGPTQFFDLASITDGVGNTTEVFYEPTTRVGLAIGEAFLARPDVPRHVSRVLFADGSESFFGFVDGQTIHDDIDGYAGSDSLSSQVTDVRGRGRLYTFGEVETSALKGGPMTPFTRLLSFRTMTISHWDGDLFGNNVLTELGQEVFEFEPAAAYALSKVTDFSGNVTTYTYDEAVDLEEFPSAFEAPFQYHDDPSTESKWLRRAVYDAGGNTVALEPDGGVQPGEAGYPNITKRFTYGPFRIMDSVSVHADEQAGTPALRRTETAIDGSTGLRTSETVFDGNGEVISHSAYGYSEPGDADYFAGFLTSETVVSAANYAGPGTWSAGGGYADGDPAWVVDLTTLRAPNAKGWEETRTVIVDGRSLTSVSGYDHNGNQTFSRDPNGNLTTSEFDALNRLVKTTLPDNGSGGRVTENSYDAAGRLVMTEVERDGAAAGERLRTFYHHDVRGRLVAEVVDLAADRDGDAGDGEDETWGDGVSDWTRAEAGQINDPRDGTDLVTTYAYDPAGLQTQVVDRRGAITFNDYDDLRRLSATTHATGVAGVEAITTFEYDPTRNSGGTVFNISGFKPTRTTDPRGYVSEAWYDATYRPWKTSVQFQKAGERLDGDGGDESGVSYTSHNDLGQVTHVIDPLGKTTVSEPDVLGRVFRVTNADQSVVTSSFTTTGLTWRMIDERGNTTDQVFDAAGRLTEVLAPAVLVDDAGAAMRPRTQNLYDANGNVTCVVDANGNITVTEFDSRNLAVRTISPQVWDAEVGAWIFPETTTEYDGVGNVVAVTDARGYRTETAYDHANRAVRVTQPEVAVYGGAQPVAPTTVSHYDKNGNVVAVIDPNGNRVDNTYDALNRLETTATDTGAAGGVIVESFGYDLSGNRVVVIDGLGQETHFAYDGMGRNTFTFYGLGERSDVAPGDQDPNGDIAGVIADPVGYQHKSELLYDAVNLVAKRDALGREVLYTYDDRHRLANEWWYDAPGGNLEKRLTSTYDVSGNLLSVIEVGNLFSDENVNYSYDGLNRVVTERSAGKVHRYGYDLAGNRTRAWYDLSDAADSSTARREMVSTFDALNRMATIVEDDRTSEYGYDADSRVVRKGMANGQLIRCVYDAAGRLVEKTGFHDWNAAAGNELYTFSTLYDAGGNVRWIFEEVDGQDDRTVINTYDGANRLVQEFDSHGDPNGVTKTYGYDAANNRRSLLVVGGAEAGLSEYFYAGSQDPIIIVANRRNQVGWVEKDGVRTVEYVYDLEGNRSGRTVVGGAANGDSDSYTYDHRNRLVGLDATRGGVATAYSYTYDHRTRRTVRDEGGAVSTVSFSGGTSVAEYDGGGAVEVDYVRGSGLGGGIGSILYTVRSGAASFNHYNHRGDVVAKTGELGSLDYFASYEAFGTRPRETGTNPDRQRANTKEEDPHGLLNEGFRYRDLEAGVFLTRDPAGFVDGPNLYSYVRQNPWTSYDPYGLYDWQDAKRDFVDPWVDFASGTWGAFMAVNDALNQAVYHPIDTTKAIGAGIKNDYELLTTDPIGATLYTLDHYKTVATEKLTTAKGHGELLVEVGLPIKGTKLLGSAKKLGNDGSSTGVDLSARRAVEDQELVDLLVDARVEKIASGEKKSGDATFAVGRDGNGDLTDVYESIPNGGAHAEPQVIAALADKPRPHTVAVDQEPCLGCQSQLKEAGVDRTIVPQSPSSPDITPKSAAEKAARGKSDFKPTPREFDQSED